MISPSSCTGNPIFTATLRSCSQNLALYFRRERGCGRAHPLHWIRRKRDKDPSAQLAASRSRSALLRFSVLGLPSHARKKRRSSFAHRREEQLTQKRPAVHLNVLTGDEARAGTAEEAHGGGDVGGLAAPADQRV